MDDAAVFPPGDMPLPEAVTAHRGHRSAAYSPLVGPFVVSDVRLPDLLEVLRATEQPEPLPVSVVVTGGAGAIEPAVRWARAEELALHGVEFALRDETDLAHNARRVTTAVDQLLADGHLDDEVLVHVEPPRLHGDRPTHSWLAALDEVAAMDHRLKFRLGGVSEEAFPGSAEVATCIQAALDRELAFKCTAGLHHALRHRDAVTGFEHHGFLNVLLATRASLDGASDDEVVAALDEQDAEKVLARLEDTGADTLTSTRRWFTSFGSCSVRDAVDDLVRLELLPQLAPEMT